MSVTDFGFVLFAINFSLEISTYANLSVYMILYCILPYFWGKEKKLYKQSFDKIKEMKNRQKLRNSGISWNWIYFFRKRICWVLSLFLENAGLMDLHRSLLTLITGKIDSFRMQFHWSWKNDCKTWLIFHLQILAIFHAL